MPLPALVQVYDEVRRLAVAGSAVAPGDFRLEKLLGPLEQLGKKAPVFAKIADGVRRVRESDERSAGAALLELSNLVGAVLHTQGDTGLTGELEPLPTLGLPPPETQASARALAPVLEALRTKGPGRLERVKDAHRRGLFEDLRLVEAALDALDHSHPELADFVATTVLPEYGPALVPRLRASFDPKGRGGDVRRLWLLHALDPAAARPLVLAALEDGGKEVRLMALGCLGQAPGDLELILERRRSRVKEERAAAYQALGRLGDGPAAEALAGAVDTPDLELAVAPLQASRSPSVRAKVREAFTTGLTDLLDAGDGPKESAPLVSRQLALLEALPGDPGLWGPEDSDVLLAAFAARDRLAKKKGDPGGKDLVLRLVSVMSTGPAPLARALVDILETLPADSVGEVFAAAVRGLPAAEVFATFSPLVFLPPSRRRAPDRRRSLVLDQLASGSSVVDFPPAPSELGPHLDPRWLERALELRDFEVAQRIAPAGHPGAGAFAGRALRERLTAKADAFTLYEALRFLVHMRPPDTVDLFILALGSMARGAALAWVAQLIPHLPRAEAEPKLEALLPSLPDWMVDPIVGGLTELKRTPDPRGTHGEEVNEAE